jgi:3D (Asp-Asp-Asp) domain-containing protein
MTKAIGPQASTTAAIARAARAVRSVRASLRASIRSGGRYLAALFDRIVNRIRGVAPVVLGLGLGVAGVGCESKPEVAAIAPVIEPLPPAKLESAETGPHQLGQFTITFYYVIGEDEVPAKPVLVAQNDNRGNRSASERGANPASAADDDAELAAITPDDRVTLYGQYGGNKCEPIADVSKEFASQVALQGTGKLRDGRMVNIAGACNCRHSPCFNVTQAQWGTAGSGKLLQPFRTVAVDPKVVKLGTLLYVPLLEGRRMPGRSPWGGYVHDGCVIADDTGGHIAGNRLDLFVGRKAYFLGLSGSGGSHAWARHVPVFDGTGICERKGRQVGRKAASI